MCNRASVFVSFASADEKVAREIVAALEQAGHSCWFAPREVGGGRDYASEIDSAVRSAQRFLLLFSPAAEQSEHVRREIHLAAEYRTPIVPIRTAAVKPAGRYAYFLAGLQWIDLFGGQHDEVVARVVAAVGRDGEQQLPQVVHSPVWLAIECAFVLLLLLAASWMLSEATDGPLFLQSTAGAAAVLVVVSLLGVAVHVSRRVRLDRAARAPVWMSVVCLSAAGASLGSLAWLHGQWTHPLLLRPEIVRNMGTVAWPIVPISQLPEGGVFARVLIPPEEWRSESTKQYIKDNGTVMSQSPLKSVLSSDNSIDLMDRLREDETAGYWRMTAVYLTLSVAGVLLLAAALASLVALTKRFVARKSILASGAFS
jgi:hypothetical protein